MKRFAAAILAVWAFPATAQPTFRMPEHCFVNYVFNRAAASRATTRVSPAFQEAMRISPVVLDPVPDHEHRTIMIQAFPGSGQVILGQRYDSTTMYYATDRQGNLIAALEGNEFSPSSWVRLDIGDPSVRSGFIRIMGGFLADGRAAGICSR